MALLDLMNKHTCLPTDDFSRLALGLLDEEYYSLVGFNGSSQWKFYKCKVKTLTCKADSHQCLGQVVIIGVQHKEASLINGEQ